MLKGKLQTIGIFAVGVLFGVGVAVIVQRSSHPIIKHAIDKPSTEVNNDINKLKNKKGSTDITSKITKDSTESKKWWQRRKK